MGVISPRYSDLDQFLVILVGYHWARAKWTWEIGKKRARNARGVITCKGEPAIAPMRALPELQSPLCRVFVGCCWKQ